MEFNPLNISPEQLAAESEALKRQIIDNYAALEDTGVLDGLADNEPLYSNITVGEIARPLLYEQARFVDRRHQLDISTSSYAVRGINISRNTDDAFDYFIGYVCQDGIEILGLYEWGDVAGGERIAQDAGRRFFGAPTLEKACELLQAVENRLLSDKQHG